MDSDEKEFVENISWDTESDECDAQADDETINMVAGNVRPGSHRSHDHYADMDGASQESARGKERKA